MTRKPTHYDVLGVPSTATAAEIRAAYVALMKVHHPDATVMSGRGASLAPLINRCYATLRDAGRRSAYDAHLALQSEPPEIAKAPSRALRARKERSAWQGTAFLAIAASLVCAPLILPLIAGPTSTRLSLPSLNWSAPAPPPAAPDLTLSFPAAAAIRHHALAATSMNSGQAMDASRECFQRASQQGTFSAAALCIAFDEAFLYWHKAPGLIGSLPPYFNDDMVNMRETEALAAFGPAGEAKLDDIRHRAFLALLDHVNATNSKLANADQPAASPASTDVAQSPQRGQQAPVP